MRRIEVPLPFDAAGFVDRLLDAATPSTRIVFASHVASTTALVLPVQALCAAARERGLTTVIDAYAGRSPFERRLQWQGTRDISALLAVPAAIEFQQAHDWPAQRRRCHAMACDLQRRVLARNGLTAIAPDEAFGQMVAIPVLCDNAEALRRWLFGLHRIEAPVTQHAGRHFVRISVQAYNSDADLDVLEAALRQAGV